MVVERVRRVWCVWPQTQPGPAGRTDTWKGNKVSPEIREEGSATHIVAGAGLGWAREPRLETMRLIGSNQPDSAVTPAYAEASGSMVASGDSWRDDLESLP